MLKNYMKIAYRNIIKQKIYSVINILGLALGLTVCILVGLYIYQEFNYDNYHENGDRLYRVSMKTISPTVTRHTAETPALVAPNLKGNFPEIEKISRIYFSGKDLITFDNKKFYEKDIVFADEDFFNMFSYKTILGNTSDFLKKKDTIILTRDIAEKYFGNENPLGKIFTYNNKVNLEITGVIENIPVNSHFTFDMVTTYETIKELPAGNYLEQWGATFGSYTYIMLYSDIDLKQFSSKVGPFLTEKMESSPLVKRSIDLQPVSSINIYSDISDEINPNSSISYIMMLGSISLFILILACINFINLTTARAVKRAREIGVRKVFGAYKLQLIKQFLGESILITFIALGFAFVFVELFEPSFSQLIGSELIYNCFNNIFILSAIIGTSLIVGVIAGLYPSFVLTHFQPVQVIKGMNTKGKSGSTFLRKGLVLFQFSISIILIIFTILINQQIRFMRSYDMGFDKDQVIIVRTPERMSRNSETIIKEIIEIQGVINSTASLGAPIMDSGFGTNLTPDMNHEEEDFMISVKMIDNEFLDFYDINLLEGKRLSDLKGADFSAVTMINEATVKKLGFKNNEEALGHAYTIGLSDGIKRFKPEIIGVVKDFHFNSLHEEVSPLLFMNWPFLFQEISIRINPNKMHETIQGIKKVWEKFYPTHPFDYIFLDEKVDKLYKSEETSFRVISTFSILAIIIACLGLLGLTFYTTEQRRKEIGIRKILGASIPNIIKFISSGFLKLVLIANLIAWPVSYLMINKWLESFPYKVGINFFVFLAAGSITLLISLITIGYTVLKSAANNPIKSIRYE